MLSELHASHTRLTLSVEQERRRAPRQSERIRLDPFVVIGGDTGPRDQRDLMAGRLPAIGRQGLRGPGPIVEPSRILAGRPRGARRLRDSTLSTRGIFNNERNGPHQRQRRKAAS
jgi:hypothetical protein